MLTWLKQTLAQRAIRNDPIWSALVDEAQRLQRSLQRDQRGWSEETYAKWTQDAFERISAIRRSENPISAFRLEFAAAATGWAEYEVMLLTPVIDDDSTGMVGRPGVTGQLKQKLPIFIQKHKDIREFVHELSITHNDDTPYYVVSFCATREYYRLCLLNKLRLLLKDYHPDANKDWFKPFLYSMFVWHEDKHRELIGMPPALDKIAVLSHSTMFNGVMNGDRYPDMEWREHFRDGIIAGHIPIFEP